MRKTPFRQIHMDFHTSPDIPDIAGDFNGAAFAAMLKDAHVESINLFAKCHHGYYYYPTRLGTVHPNLKINLLKEQLDACVAEGIRTLIYTCVGWSEDTAKNHPEWQEVGIDGVIGSRRPFSRPYYSWQKLCLNNKAYRAYMKAEFDELHELFNPHGLWIDIIFQNQCICPTCLEEMRDMGLNPENLIDRYRHDRLVQISYMQEMYGYLKTLNPELEIYFNGHPYEMDLEDDEAYATARKRACNTFIDVESLPSELWGYAHFPVAVNYINKYDTDITMMNGKFHTSWGDFGSLRNRLALEYECFRALANGAGCCIGDQLHPSGKMDATVYKRIGEVLGKVRNKEKWCRDTRKVAQIGVFNTRRSGISNPNDHNADLPVEGAYRILTELHYTFDILNLQDDLRGYDLLIMPDNVFLTEQAAVRIEGYLQQGGKLLVSARSGLGRHETGSPEFMLDCLGVSYLGKAQYNPRYMKIEKTAFPEIEEMTYVTYEKGVDVEARECTEVLAPVVNPYFNRGEFQFCSHRQTPPEMADAQTPAIVRNGNAIYIANPIFSDYAKNRCKVYKEIVAGLFRKLGVEATIQADVPSFVEITARSMDRYLIVHLLNYIIERKSRTIDTIEEMVPLYNRDAAIRLEKKPVRIFRFDSENGTEVECPFVWENGRASVVLTEIGGHEMLIVERE